MFSEIITIFGSQNMVKKKPMLCTVQSVLAQLDTELLPTPEHGVIGAFTGNRYTTQS